MKHENLKKPSDKRLREQIIHQIILLKIFFVVWVFYLLFFESKFVIMITIVLVGVMLSQKLDKVRLEIREVKDDIFRLRWFSK